MFVLLAVVIPAPLGDPSHQVLQLPLLTAALHVELGRAADVGHLHQLLADWGRQGRTKASTWGAEGSGKTAQADKTTQAQTQQLCFRFSQLSNTAGVLDRDDSRCSSPNK